MDNEEINEAVAVTVMGWHGEVEDSYWPNDDKIWRLPNGHRASNPFQPATNIAAAFEMEEKIWADGKHEAYADLLEDVNNSLFYLAHASPLARCQAALKVYEGD